MSLFKNCCKSNDAVMVSIAPKEVAPTDTILKDASTAVEETATETGSIAPDDEVEKVATEKGYKCCGIY